MIALVALNVWPVQWARQLYRTSGEAERRSFQFSIALAVGAAIPMTLIGALLFAVVGIE
ncbi:hypothetical protein [Ilumatobacter nonamiensis]|uniref:hypothetical protein n=1 Tax=Ilumatobacter nonamiensis TaxID=467093 RepID=UPI000349EA7A|nr:hypothetical protein [Ilumatobacter nonamiensis]